MARTKKVECAVDKIIANRLESTKHLLLVKGKEYVRGNDRLHNFRRAVEMNRGISLPHELHGMLTKHLVSYLDILDDIKNGVPVSEAKVDEKVGDIIVYFLLQEASIKEHISKSVKSKK
jgi:hypothetical protein